MNAVAHMAELISPDAVRRLATIRVNRFERAHPVWPTRTPATDEAIAIVTARWQHDLCGLLNAMNKDELVALAGALRLASAADHAPAIRLAVWARGAELERDGALVAPAVQPRPILLGGHLVVQAPPRGMAPPSASYPRPVPAAIAAAPLHEEPDTLDDLLAAADRLIGVRLGPRGHDKGAWGLRAAALLGIAERGHDEPDWRGDVEIKTVPVEREASGYWAVVEDPAIAMVGSGGLAKLQRTLWLARATIHEAADPSMPSSAPRGGPDATIVSWYLLDWDAEIARLARRYLHLRPKGPKHTRQKGLYLYKRFFADAGLLASLNGIP